MEGVAVAYRIARLHPMVLSTLQLQTRLDDPNGIDERHGC
jgi:hypothetical protein